MMGLTWGSHPIIENVGPIAQVVTSSSTGFPYTHIFASNSHGDIFQFERGSSDSLKKIFTGNGTQASQLAYANNSLFGVLNGTVFIGETSGEYIYKFFSDWTEFGVNDSGSPTILGSSLWLYIVYPAGVLRCDGLPGTWQTIGGPGKMFACNEDTIFGISPDDSVFQYVSGNTWKKIRDQPTASIVAGGNLMCAVDKASGDIFKFNGAAESWTKIGGPGRMFSIGNAGELYGLTPDGGAVWQWNGQPDSWTKVGPTPAGKIFAGGGVLCATGPNHQELWCFGNNPAAA